jgi:N utilization substance protein B
MTTGRRRLARERALCILYEAELKGVPTSSVLSDLGVEPDEFAVHLVMEVTKRRCEVDELIQRHSEGWAIERMPCIDRNVLRISVAELLDEVLEVPAPVVISEAVELAKMYSTEQSASFVNGLLSGVLIDVEGASRVPYPAHRGTVEERPKQA